MKDKVANFNTIDDAKLFSDALKKKSSTLAFRNVV